MQSTTGPAQEVTSCPRSPAVLCARGPRARPRSRLWPSVGLVPLQADLGRKVGKSEKKMQMRRHEGRRGTGPTQH
eukprot:1765135-Pyramimonas_sp.AAC.1